MADFLHVWNHLPDFVSNHLVPFLEDAADAVGDAAEEAADEAADDIAETAKEIAQQHSEAADKLIAQKTGHVAVISAYFIIPIALIAGAFAVKIIYGLFTKTADKIGEGIKSSSAKIQSALGDSSPETSEPGKPKRKLLLGEILTRYVADSITDEDIKKALTTQKSTRPKKLIGELLLEERVVTKSDVAQAIKIQEKLR
jgi:hypothetical protein